ncbi:MAG TPA: MmgE/PrpD family protein [Acidiferrobacterales bacterium]|nr:MmgE/PrpD family protein [Acidiferrobacterales bacterium]
MARTAHGSAIVTGLNLMTSAPDSVAQSLAKKIAGLAHARLPATVRTRAEELLLDVAGLCVVARRTDYVQAVCESWKASGPCTALGHAGGFDVAAAAMINGTAAHGEDFDDTFEGGPVHTGAVIIPAVLAACERYGREGRAALLGIAVGCETLCRLSLVAPKAVHRAGFHPTSVFGTMAAAAAVGATLGLDAKQLVNALGIAGSMASGIIEYLSSGAWTKRMHPGWAAQAGLRAALMGQHGFIGPHLVFEGTHGLFNGFAHTTEANFDALTENFGKRWWMETIAFKPYACGTMILPYIDCALKLVAQGVHPEDIIEMDCETAEGIVHRLWEPLASKQRPPNAYAAKFSLPFCIATAFCTGGASLDAFTETAVRDKRVLALAAKIRYQIDPHNPYPQNYTGHARVTLRDGRMLEARQPHLRGGAKERLTRAELEEKFARNATIGGWSQERISAFHEFNRTAFDGPINLSAFRT